jgi:hypothetical protein
MNKSIAFFKCIVFLGCLAIALRCSESRQSAITKIVIRDLNDSIRNCIIGGEAPKYSGKYFFSKFKSCRLEEKVGDVYLYIDGKMLPDYLRLGGDTTNFAERVVLCVGDSNNIIYYHCSDGSNFVLYAEE